MGLRTHRRVDAGVAHQSEQRPHALGVQVEVGVEECDVPAGAAFPGVSDGVTLAAPLRVRQDLDAGAVDGLRLGLGPVGAAVGHDEHFVGEADLVEHPEAPRQRLPHVELLVERRDEHRQ